MKKEKCDIFSIVFIMLIFMFMCSCRDASISEKNSDSSTSHNINSIDIMSLNNVSINTSFDTHSDQLCFTKTQGCCTSMVSSAKGYYFTRGIQGDMFLYYTDKATMKTVPLCAKPDCLHAEEKDPSRKKDCNAFLNDNVDMVGDLLFYDSYIYLPRVKSGMDQPTVLTQISMNGTQRKDVYVFKVYPKYMIIHRGYLYYETSEDNIVSGEDNSTISRSGVYRIPMDDLNKAPELIFENNGVYAFIGPLTGYENNIYFQYYRFEDTNMQKCDSGLACYHIESNNISIVSNIETPNKHWTY